MDVKKNEKAAKELMQMLQKGASLDTVLAEKRNWWPEPSIFALAGQRKASKQALSKNFSHDFLGKKQAEFLEAVAGKPCVLLLSHVFCRSVSRL